ncbi:MAG: DMT family transporter [Alphaproteobacteria bacterium]|nr:DMT family transporter [Alphaproteobacteria bacterium]
MGSEQSGRGIGFALAGAFFYGFNITFAKISAELGVQGPMIVAERVLVMIAIGLVLALLTRSSLHVVKGERVPMALLGLGSMGVSIGYLSSVAFIPITVAAVIFYTFPILIVIASPFIDKKKLTPAMLGIVALAFVGVVLVLGMASGDLDLRGVALAALASVSAAMQFFAGTRCHKSSNAAKIVVTQAIVLPGAIASVFATGGVFSMETQILAAVPIWLTIGGFVLGFVFQILALARISATVAGLLFCLEPVVAAITSALVLDERLLPVQYFGGFLVIVAIALTMVVERRVAR